MSRYRRKSYRGHSGTNFVRQKYSYFVDMQTDPDKMQIIKVTAGGRMPQIRLRPFFGTFKYFKLGKVSVRFVPAATLPVDPTGLSYDLGEQTVDPRDQMNPGLVRITNGEDVSKLTSILSGVDAERAYYTTMLDPRWFKFPLQSGFKRVAKPLLWNIAQTKQAVVQSTIHSNFTVQPGLPIPSDSDTSFQSELLYSNGTAVNQYAGQDPVTQLPFADDPLDLILMQSGRVKMGWMPTDMFNSNEYGPNAVPEVDLVTCILPKAYKTRYFYRCYIEEEVLFKEPVTMTPIVSTFTGEGESLVPLQFLNHAAVDRFLVPGSNYPQSGGTQVLPQNGEITKNNRVNGGTV